jgi:hypothetical protein
LIVLGILMILVAAFRFARTAREMMMKRYFQARVQGLTSRLLRFLLCLLPDCCSICRTCYRRVPEDDLMDVNYSEPA